MTKVEGKSIAVGDQVSQSETVYFESVNPFLLEEVGTRDKDAKLEAKGELFLPRGEIANRPGVVIVHGLGGQTHKRELTYAHKLSTAGFATLAIDSFDSRGFAKTPELLTAVRVSTWSMLADAFAALRFLARHPGVNPNAISVIGFSWGGMITVLSAYEQLRRLYVGDMNLRFAGHASYYGCSIPRMEDPRTTGSPLLVMVAKNDRNVSVERTEQICEDLRAGGSDVTFRSFDAYHQWDGIDKEKRHFMVSLADVQFRITRENKVIDEGARRAIDGFFSQLKSIVSSADFHGYDMLRSEALHSHTDSLLLSFLQNTARKQDARVKNVAQVCAGEIGVDPGL